MSSTTINCPHCGKATRLDLTREMTTQKCDRCGVRLSSVDTGLSSSKEFRPTEPPNWRRAKVGEWDDEKQQSDGDRAPDSSSRKMLIGVAAGLLIVGAGLAWYAAKGEARDGQPPPQMASETTAGSEDENARGYEVLKNRLNECVENTQKFLDARSAEDIIPLIAESERWAPIVRQYYESGEGKGVLPLSEYEIAPLSQQMFIERIQRVVVNYSTPDQLPRAIAFKEFSEGQWLLDWPSAVGFSEIPIAEFLEKKDTTPRLCRVLAVLDDYYNRDFSNERALLCLKFSDTARKHAFYGYVPRDSAAAKAIKEIKLPVKHNGVPVAVRLKFPENASQPDQVEIVDFIGAGWILEADQEAVFAPKATLEQ